MRCPYITVPYFDSLTTFSNSFRYSSTSLAPWSVKSLLLPSRTMYGTALYYNSRSALPPSCNIKRWHTFRESTISRDSHSQVCSKRGTWASEMTYSIPLLACSLMSSFVSDSASYSSPTNASAFERSTPPSKAALRSVVGAAG